MSEVQWPAARVLGRGAVPGNLALSDSHLKFSPAGVATRIQGMPFSVQLRHLAGAGIIEDKTSILRRARTRLSITLGDGSQALFEVSNPDQVAEVIRDRLGGGS